MRVIRWQDLRNRVPLSRTTIWRLERKGNFPRRFRIGANSVGWLESEIDRWIDTRAGRLSTRDPADQDNKPRETGAAKVVDQ